jgi:FkbM family methyltransferase
MTKRKVKNFLTAIGLYPFARSMIRKFSSSYRKIFHDEVRLYGDVVKKGDLVFDVGVNVGQKSEIFLFLGAKVVGVEPNPKCKRVIDYQFGRNSNFTLVQKAVGAEVGEANLFFVGTSAAASLREDWPYLSFEGSPVENVLTPVTTLDELIDTFGVPVLCKIDVEGFEKEVIRGLKRPLPLVTMEYHLAERDNLRACLDHLASLAPIEANANLMDTGDFVYETWMAPQEFLNRADLPDKADCWVRLKQAA